MDYLNTNLAPSLYSGYSLIKLFEQKDCLKTISGNSDLTTTIAAVSFISNITIAALEAFISQRMLKDFDPLVGDTACQLRAAKILDLADLYSLSEEFRDEVQKAHKEAKAILDLLPQVKKALDKSYLTDSEFKKAYPQGLSPSQLCVDMKILQNVSQNIGYTILSFCLTQTKKKRCDGNIKITETTKTDQLERFNNGLAGQNNEKKICLSKKKVHEFVTAMQVELAAMSVAYLHNEATLLPESPSNKFTVQVLKNEIRYDESGRACAPCFYSMETLFERLIDKNQYVLMDINRWNHEEKIVGKRLKLLYAPDQVSRTFKLIEPTEKLLSKGVFVLIGNSKRENQHLITDAEYIKLFESYSLKEIWNVNLASHAQYPGKLDLAKPPVNDARRTELAAIAQKIGCAFENMSLFVIDHIFCDNLKSALANKER